MNFRVVYVSSRCALNYKNDSLAIHNDKGETLIPLSDISVVLIENLSSTITTKLLSNFTQNKIVVIVCDEYHLPNGIFLPYNGKIRMLESYKYQTSCNKEFKNKLWDKIIKNKIYNQATVLEYASIDSASMLISMLDDVSNGDSLNIESQTAQLYWKNIFRNSFGYFTRNMPDIRNSALNYGYAIIRSIISNALSCKGFVLYDGIHHCSELNQFNLADDIIEPFRAFVDLEVYKIFEKENCDKTKLDSELKQRLLSIVDNEVYIDKQKFTLINAIDKYCDSVYNCYKLDTEKKLIEVYVNIWK